MLPRIDLQHTHAILAQQSGAAILLLSGDPIQALHLKSGKSSPLPYSGAPLAVGNGRLLIQRVQSVRVLDLEHAPPSPPKSDGSLACIAIEPSFNAIAAAIGQQLIWLLDPSHRLHAYDLQGQLSWRCKLHPGPHPRLIPHIQHEHIAASSHQGVAIIDSKGEVLDQVAIEGAPLYDFGTDPSWRSWLLSVHGGAALYRQGRFDDQLMSEDITPRWGNSQVCAVDPQLRHWVYTSRETLYRQQGSSPIQGLGLIKALGLAAGPKRALRLQVADDGQHSHLLISWCDQGHSLIKVENS